MNKIYLKSIKHKKNEVLLIYKWIEMNYYGLEMGKNRLKWI